MNGQFGLEAYFGQQREGFKVKKKQTAYILKKTMFKKCKNCGHIIWIDDEANKGNAVYKHKLSNHSMYCPCRKPEP